MAQQNQQNQPQQNQQQPAKQIVQSVKTFPSVEGMIYVNKSGERKFVDSGADCSDMTEEDLKAALAAGHVRKVLVEVEQ